MGAAMPALDGAQYLTFRVGAIEYGIGILKVKEIIPYETVTPVPTTPVFVKGVVSLRGTAVPVVDLGVKLGSPDTVPTKLACILITEVTFEAASTLMGLIVDSVSQVLDLAPGEIQEPPPFGPGVRLDYLAGVAKRAEGFVLILDIDRILSSEEIFAMLSLEALLRAMEAQASEQLAPTEPQPSTSGAAPEVAEAGPAEAEPPDPPAAAAAPPGQRRRKPRRGRPGSA